MAGAAVGGWRGIARRTAVVVVIAGVCAVPALGTLTGRVNLMFVAEADSLLLHELIPDLLGGGSVSNWTVPYSTYLVPDWPLYAIALALGSTPASTVALFAFFQLVLLAVSVGLLARAVDKSSALALAVAGMALVTMTTVRNGFPVVYLLTSYVHGGTAIMGLVSLGLLTKWVGATEHQRRLLAGSALVTFAAVASDRLAVVWSLAPMGAAVVVATAAGMVAPRALATWVAAHLLTVLAAWPVAGFIFPTRTEYDVELGFRPRFGYERFLDTVREIDAFTPWLLPAAGVSAAIAVAVLAVGRSVFGYRHHAYVRVVLLVYFVALVAASVGSQVAMVGPVPPHARYSTAALLFPMTVAPVVLLAGINATRSWWRSALGMSTALPVLMFGVRMLGDVHSPASPVPADCVVDATASSDSRHGIAAYWDARPLQVYSEGRLIMSEFGPDLQAYPQNSNRREVKQGYDFAVVAKAPDGSDLLEADLTARAGPPLARVDCGPLIVLDYGPRGLSVDR